MKSRLALSIISTAAEETAIAALFLWGFPRMDVQIPVWILPSVMLAWAGYSVVTYRLTTRALQKERLIGLENMVGSKGEVVCQLAPEGLVRIRGELWAAVSESGGIDTGRPVTVIAQERLKLVVRETKAGS